MDWVSINQWFSAVHDSVPESRPHPGCHNFDHVIGIQWVEAKNAQEHPTMKSCAAQNTNR